MNFLVVAAWLQSIISLGVVVFQVALVCGAPWGEYTMGGQRVGALSPRLRAVAGVSALIMLAQFGHYLAQAGVLDPLLGAPWINVVNWFWFAFAVLGLGMNSISRSKKERNLWVPVLAVSAICTLVVALQV